MTSKSLALSCLLVIGSCSRASAPRENDRASGADRCPLGPIVRRAPEFASSDSAGVIRGTVLDAATGLPIRGRSAVVNILSGAGGQQLDSLGQFRIVRNASFRDTVRLLFRAIGFENQPASVVLEPTRGLVMRRYLTYSSICLAPMVTGEIRAHVP